LTDQPTIILTIPPPPSTNKLWIRASGKRQRIKSPEYRSWLASAGWQVRMQAVGMPHLDCRFNADIQVPISRRDTDNWIKALLDLMQAVGIVSNDGNIHQLIVTPVHRENCRVALTPLPGMEGVRAPASATSVLQGAARPVRPKASEVKKIEALRDKVRF
jgi:Holliday junction resolvase RusA-like endonuclease